MPNRDDLWSRAGDIGRVALIGSALALPLRRRDLDSGFDALTSILACSALSKGVKAFWDEPRPNGEDRNSFPSQHAAECFAAALSLGRARGAARTAAVGVAAAVAITRIFARKHRVPDVIAGSAMGVVAASLPLRS